MPDKIVNHFVLADGSTAKYDAGGLLNLDETVSLAGYAPDAKAVGDRLTDVENLAERLNEGGLELKDEVIAVNVEDWLDTHPEATTTVQDDSLTTAKYKDGSVTTPKLADGAVTSAKVDADFLKTIENAYVTPQMFGAVADNVHDDTQAFQNAINSGEIVYVPRGNYKITNTLTIPATPADIVGKKRTTIIGVYNDTILNFTGDGNVIENNGILYMENIRIESLKQNANGIYNSGSIRLYNCQSNGNGLNGLMFDENVHVVHSIIDGCTFYRNGENGIRCVTTIDHQKTSIRIYNCYCAGNGSETSETTAQNDLSGNGILLGACLGVTVFGTVCEYNHGSGILIRNDGAYAVMAVVVLSCYFEGNRLANIYLYSSRNDLYHKEILIKSNYYSAYPATAPEYYTNSLLPQTIRTVINSDFKIIDSIVDDNYYDVTLYKNGNEITDKPLKCKVVAYTTDDVAPNSILNIPYNTIKSQYIPNNTLVSITAAIGAASDSTTGEVYNDYNGSRVRIKNTYSTTQYYLLTIQILYE